VYKISAAQKAMQNEKQQLKTKNLSLEVMNERIWNLRGTFEMYKVQNVQIWSSPENRQSRLNPL